jgi:hypothetical protein
MGHSIRRREPSVARRRNRDMNHTPGLAALLILLAGCTPSQPPSQVKASPTAAVHTFAGGCAGTVLTDAVPPIWAQSGWSHTTGTPWPVPWAFGMPGNTLAYVWGTQLVSAQSSRVDGPNNKVNWVSKDNPGEGLTVEGRPLGQTQPVVTIAGGPSEVNLPTAGCWTFRLTWNASGQHSSTINLEVLPAGK